MFIYYNEIKHVKCEQRHFTKGSSVVLSPIINGFQRFCYLGWPNILMKSLPFIITACKFDWEKYESQKPEYKEYAPY